MLAVMLLPAFNAVTGKQLSLPASYPVFWVSIVCLLLLTGLVAGSYPAFFLSSLKPNRVLKGSLKFSAAATFFRKGLVVFQFVIAQLLIVGTIVVVKQMHYFRNRPIGFEKDGIA